MSNKEIKYLDKFGEINSEVTGDRSPFFVRLNNTEFSFDLEDLTPINSNEIDKRFVLDSLGNLTDYKLESKIAVKISIDGQISDSFLNFKLMNSKSDYGGSLSRGEIKLKIDKEVYQTHTFDHFETGIESLNRLLPNKIKLVCCFNCQFSDYSPAGQGFFGMMCFKSSKETYLKAQSKDDYFNLAEKSNLVGETDLCEEFTTRTKGTGYRG